MTRKLVWLLLSALFPACITAEFVQTDYSHLPRWSGGRPVLFIDRLPDRPTRSVGLVSVNAPDTAALSMVLKAAVDKGYEVGCWGLIDRGVYNPAHVYRSTTQHQLPTWVVRLEVPKRRVGLATLAVYTPPTVVQPTPRTSREFVCVVLDESRRPPVRRLPPSDVYDD